jgi:hypothetical protein
VCILSYFVELPTSFGVKLCGDVIVPEIVRKKLRCFSGLAASYKVSH